jgi:hypothetical protein
MYSEICLHRTLNKPKTCRILFGDSLWTFIIHPSIVYGCVVWFPSAIPSAQNIESLQYQAGKIF